MGYSVYRVRNKEVESSPFDVVGRIVDRYYQILEVEGEQKIPAPKIKKTFDPSRLELLPEDLGRLIPAWTVALNSKLTFENWTADYFKQILSVYDTRLVTNQCAMERIILYLLGLNVRDGNDVGKNSVDNMIDFEYYYILSALYYENSSLEQLLYELLEVVVTLAAISNSFAGKGEISGDRWTNRG